MCLSCDHQLTIQFLPRQVAHDRNAHKQRLSKEEWAREREWRECRRGREGEGEGVGGGVEGEWRGGRGCRRGREGEVLRGEWRERV